MKPYPIVEVNPEWTIGDEAMGSREKFWYQVSTDQKRWLFKYPRPSSGEHWAEKVAAEVAKSIGVAHAEVELAETNGIRGSVAQSFAGDSELVHGNALLSAIMKYDINKRHGQSDHSLKNIFRVLMVADAAFEMTSPLETVRQQFAGYLTLDALIGNTDRHHQNWGLLAERTLTGFRVSLAPTFDHASSLGRDISDETRARYLRGDTVGRYAGRARGRVYWDGSNRYGPSPLDLVRWAAEAHPELFRAPLAQVRQCRSGFAEIVRRVPDDWMSPTTKDFTVAMLDYNATELEECLK